MTKRRWNFPEVLMLLLSLQFLPPCWFTELLDVDLQSSFLCYIYGRLYIIYYNRFYYIALRVPTFNTDFTSHISFNCTSYFYQKFHYQDSCCLYHKFHLAATFIADFISNITDFIFTSRVLLKSDFIVWTTHDQVLYHSMSYFHRKFHITDFISLHVHFIL